MNSQRQVYFSVKDLPGQFLTAVGYFALAWIGLQFANYSGNVTIFWPASGLALAVLLIHGYRFAIGVFAGAFAAGLYVGDSVWLSAMIACGNMLEPLASVWLLRRFGHSGRIQRLPDYLKLLLLGGAGGPLVSAFFGVTGIHLASFITAEMIPNAFLHWWMADFLGIVLIAPGWLIWRNDRWNPNAGYFEGLLILTVSCLVGMVVLAGALSEQFSEYQMGFWLTPFLIWTAIRLDRHGVFLLAIMAFVQALWGAAHGMGFFATDLQQTSLLNLWMYILVISMTGMTLAIVLRESRELQEVATKGQSLLKGVIDALPDRIYFMDRDGHMLGCNLAVERDLASSELAIIGRTPPEIFPDEVLAHLDQVNRRVLADGNIVSEQLELPIPAVGKRLFDVRKLPFRNTAGEVIGVITMAHDITDEQREQQRVSTERAMLRGVMDTIPDLIFFKNVEGVYLGCNNAFERFFGAEENMIAGRTDFDFVDAETARYFREQDALMLQQGKTRVNEEWVTYPDGSRVLLETLKMPFKAADGTLLGLIGVSRDLTERRAEERERDLLHHTLASSLDEVYIFDAATLHFEFCNHGALANLGYSVDEMRSMTPLDIKPYFSEESFRAQLQPLASGENEQLVFETFHRRKNGTLYPVEVRLQHFEHGDSRVFLAIIQDISARLVAEHRQRLASSVFNASAQGIIVSDAQNQITLVNLAFTRITGYSEDEVIGHNPRLLSSGIQGADFYQAMWRDIHESGFWAGELWNRRKSGEIFPEWLEISLIRDAEGRVDGYVGLFSDISERKATEEHIRVLAQHDYLTGLPNRALFTERFAQVLALADRKQEKFALIYLDLDRFKEINDNLGHHVGDALLQEVAQRLSGAIRVSDTACRMGGDEFILLIPGVEAEEDMAILAEKLIGVIAEPCEVAGYQISITTSIGIALYPAHGEDMDSLTRRADIAMYHAKELGRNQFCVFEPGMQPERQ